MAGVVALPLHPHDGDKYTETFIEGKGTPGSVTPPEDLDEITDFSGVNEKAVVRKCDWHIVPWLSLLYLLSFLDRTNIGNAWVPDSCRPVGFALKLNLVFSAGTCSV